MRDRKGCLLLSDFRVRTEEAIHKQVKGSFGATKRTSYLIILVQRKRNDERCRECKGL